MAYYNNQNKENMQQQQQQNANQQQYTNQQQNNFQLPFGCFSNLSHIGDPIHEIPLPFYRNDRSVGTQLQDTLVLNSTLELLQQQQQHQLYQQQLLQHQQLHQQQPQQQHHHQQPIIDNQQPHTLFTDINQMLENTNVNYLTLNNNTYISQPSPVLNSLLQHMPAISLQQYQQPQQPQPHIKVINPLVSNSPIFNYVPPPQQQQQQQHNGHQSLLSIPYNPSNTFVSNDNQFIQNIFTTGVQTNNNGNNNSSSKSSKKSTDKPKKPSTRKSKTTKDIESAQMPIEQHIQDQLDHIIAVQQQNAQQPQITPIEKLQQQIQQFIDNSKDRTKQHNIDCSTVSQLRADLNSLVKTSVVQLQDLVPLESYASLFQYLLRIVKDAQNVHSLSFNEDTAEKELAEFHKLEFSFEAAILILQILTIPIVGHSLCELIDDELIEFLSMFKTQFTENILGHLDPSFKMKQPVESISTTTTKQKSNKKKPASKKGGENTSEEDEDEEDDEDSDYDDSDESDEDEEDEDEQNSSQKSKSKKKKQKTSSTTSSSKKKTSTSKLKFKKRGHNYFLFMCNKVTEIFNGLSQLVNIYTPPDPFPTILVDISIPTLFIGGISFIQLAAIELLRSTYCRYPIARESIFEQTLSNLSKTPSLKKNLRTYKLKDNRSIQNITALFLQLIQSSPQHPDSKEYDISSSPPGSPEKKATPMKLCHDNVSMVILYFIDKCSTKSEDCEYRTLLDNFLADLLVLINNPEWPAANMMLHMFSVALCRILSDKTKSSDILKLLAIDVLGQIITKLKQEIMLSAEELLTLPLHLPELLPLVNVAQPTSTATDNNNSAMTIDNTSTEDVDTLIADYLEETEELNKKHSHRFGMIALTSTNKHHHIQQQNQQPQHNQNDQQQPVCQCGKFKIGSFTTKCTQCNETYHDLCAPDFSMDNQQQDWFCISCRVLNQVNNYQPKPDDIVDTTSSTTTTSSSKKHQPLSYRKKKPIKLNIMDDEDENSTITLKENRKRTSLTNAFTSSTATESSTTTSDSSQPPTNSDYSVLIHLLLNYLNSKCHSELWLSCSRQFLISSWLDNDFLKSKLTQQSKQYVLSQWSMEESYSSVKCFTVGTDVATKLFRLLSIHTKGSLFNIVNQLLYNLLSILYDTSKIARAKAMKSFSTIVEVDPSILVDEFVHTSIKNRFTDDSIAVREHTVDLIGKYILLKPDLTWKYIDYISELIADKGISVRKRVVKTLHDVCLSQIQHPKIPQLCQVLVSRINDEESIKDLVINTFKDMWFGEHEQTIVQKSKQIVEVVKQLNQDDWFVDLIHKLTDKGKANTKRASKQQKSAESISSTCQEICSYLIDMLISFDEKRRKKEYTEFLAIFKCLKIFCKINPTFLTSYAKVLHPYIKLTSKTISNEELNIFVIVTYILQKTIPMIENLDKTFLESLEKDLLILILTQGSVLVHQSIKCLCAVVENASHNFKITEEHLCKHLVILQTCGNRPKSEILRSLYITGLLVRYFDYEKRPFTIDPPSSLKMEKSNVLSEIIPIVTKLFLFTKDQDVLSKSLESIGNIIISKPSILNQDAIRNIIVRALAGETKIKETILKIYLKLLKKEAKSIQNRKDTNQDSPKSESEESATDQSSGVSENDDEEDSSMDDEKMKKKKRGPIISMNVDINGESLVSSIQKFFTSFSKLLVDSDQSVRFYAISTVDLIVKQGIINPLEAVPEIITLITDLNPKISEIAFNVLTFINQKHSSTLFKRVIESIRLCYRFHLSLGTKSPYNSVAKGLSKFYLLFRNLKQSRTTFINHIMSQFENTNRTYRYKSVEYFRFLVEILASLPYANMDEIFEIIVAIDKIVSLQGSSCMTDIQAAMGKKKKSLNDVVDDSDTNILSLFLSSLTVTLLVELKSYLIKTYDITKERAKAYLEDAKNSEKLQITQPESLTFTKSNYPFTILPTEEELLENETQKKIFLAFKTLLKEDNVDYSTITTNNANEKKSKAATARKRKSTTTASTTGRKKKESQ